MLAAPEVDHYHQPVALVVAESFEQARAATTLIRVRYDRAEGRFDLEAQQPGAPIAKSAEYGGPTESLIGDFATAFAAAPIKLDETYTVPDQAHAMMEPHATIARWDGDKLTCWTSIQQMNWGTRDVAAVLGIPRENVRLISPFIGGGFGGKGTAQTELILAAAGARLAKRPVKVALQRPIMFNNTIHRPRTIQRVMLAAEPGGRLTAIGHESWNGNLEGGRTEPCVTSTRTLYAAPNRLTRLHLTTLDLAEGNAMRAPGEAPGLMALEIAMDEMAEKLGMDPVAFRLANDTQIEPEKGIPFSTRRFADCLRIGAEKFGWSRRNPKPGAIRGAPISKAGARARLDRHGVVTIETDMTDIGTGSYTIVQQTAAEMIGVPLDKVVAKLGDSSFPETPGSGGQQGGPSVTAGVYAACMKLREAVTMRLGFNTADVTFADGQVRSGGRTVPVAAAAQEGELVAEDRMEYGDLSKRYAQQTFGAHFAEVGVDAYTGEVRVRRMVAVCAAGRIMNPKTARSQVIGGIVMGIGAALMEEMVVDKRLGFFVNHDLAGYEVPTHADVPQLEAHFIEEVDNTMSPLKAKGVGELGLTGVAPAVANAVSNATGVRVRDYPITLDKHLAHMARVA